MYVDIILQPFASTCVTFPVEYSTGSLGAMSIKDLDSLVSHAISRSNLISDQSTNLETSSQNMIGFVESINWNMGIKATHNLGASLYAQASSATAFIISQSNIQGLQNPAREPSMMHSITNLDPQSLFCLSPTTGTIQVENNTLYCPESNTHTFIDIFFWRPFTGVCSSFYILLHFSLHRLPGSTYPVCILHICFLYPHYVVFHFNSWENRTFKIISDDSVFGLLLFFVLF